MTQARVADVPFDSTLSHCDPAYVLEAMSPGLVFLDVQLCLVHANPSALRLLAFCPKESRGRPFAEHSLDSGKLTHALRRVLELNEGRGRTQIRFRSMSHQFAGGQRRTIDMGITPQMSIQPSFSISNRRKLWPTNLMWSRSLEA